MRILHTVEFYAPSVGGSQEVVKQISTHLVERGHEVTVATTRHPERKGGSIDGVCIEEFDIRGNATTGLLGEVNRYQQFLLDGKFDLMMNYAAQQWATDLVFPILNQLSYRKVLAPCGFSGLFDRRYSNYFRGIPRVLNQYDMLLFHSHNYRDIEFSKADGLKHYTVIPNGASEKEFAHFDRTFRGRYGIGEEAPLLLTVGSHTELKGHRLVIEAFDRARIGRAVLVIIGNTSGGNGCLGACKRRAWWSRVVSLGRKRVLLLNPPRADVVAAYHAADLFLFGSKLECSPIALFEAMASQTPFVTTPCGNAEEIADWTRGGVVIPAVRRPDGALIAEPEVMAHCIEDLMANRDERRRLGQTGHQAWRDRFTWERIAAQYEELYRTLVDS